jgi:hypothetical protein
MIKRRFALMDGTAGAPAAGGAASALGGDAGEGGGVLAVAGSAAQTGAAWYDGIQNADLKTWVSAKGFKDPLAVAESAYNLEKLIGHDKAGRTIVMPKDDSPAEEVQAYRAKLGVPESADAYKLPMPEGTDPAFAKVAAAWMHEAGLTPKQAEIVASKWNEHMGAGVKAKGEQMVAASNAAAEAVRAEWGTAAVERSELGRRAAQTFIPETVKTDDGRTIGRGELIGMLDQAGLTGFALRMFSEIGKNIGEHRMIMGQGSQSVTMTPSEARQKIGELKSDASWTKAYIAGDQAKVTEMSRLHMMAYPPEEGGINPGARRN